MNPTQNSLVVFDKNNFRLLYDYQKLVNVYQKLVKKIRKYKIPYFYKKKTYSEVIKPPHPYLFVPIYRHLNSINTQNRIGNSSLSNISSKPYKKNRTFMLLRNQMNKPVRCLISVCSGMWTAGVQAAAKGTSCTDLYLCSHIKYEGCMGRLADTLWSWNGLDWDFFSQGKLR